MRVTTCNTNISDISDVISCISEGKTYEYMLQEPKPENREFIKKVLFEYLKAIGQENCHYLLGLCMEEIISNSVKANIKRTHFLSNNLDINNHEDYQKGMQDFKENGLGNLKDPAMMQKVSAMGLYVKICFKVENNCLYITTRNNSVISKEEIERINKKLKLSENKSPEDIFMNSIDQTEGAGLGIIMIKKILSQISSTKDCFAISASDTETITELKIQP